MRSPRFGIPIPFYSPYKLQGHRFSDIFPSFGDNLIDLRELSAPGTVGTLELPGTDNVGAEAIEAIFPESPGVFQDPGPEQKREGTHETPEVFPSYPI